MDVAVVLLLLNVVHVLHRGCTTKAREWHLRWVGRRQKSQHALAPVRSSSPKSCERPMPTRPAT
jgi:hypothetical protein